MRYLITFKIDAPFLTNFYDYENHYTPNVGMVVYDLVKCKYTTNGNVWLDIEIDHL